METNNKIKEILLVYSNKSIDILCHPNWKFMCMDIYNIILRNPNSVSKNAEIGFKYLSDVVYNTICNKCNDNKSFEWLNNYTDYVINGGNEPLFPISCLDNEN